MRESVVDDVVEKVIRLEGKVDRIEKKLDEGLSKACEVEIDQKLRDERRASKEYTDHQIELIISNNNTLFAGLELKLVEAISSVSDEITSSFKVDIDKIHKRIDEMPKQMVWWMKSIIWIVGSLIPVIGVIATLVYLGGGG